MEPIINPWWFYVADVANSISLALAAVVLGLGVCAIMCGVHAVVEGRAPTHTKPLCIALAIFAALNCVIPSGSTIYKMLAASMATP